MALSKLRVTASALNVREIPSRAGRVLGTVGRDDTVELLDEDDDWRRIRSGRLVGWSFAAYLTPVLDSPPTGDSTSEILRIAADSSIARYFWQNRGRAPAGYVKGMALVFARVYRALKAGDAAAIEMARPESSDASKDALAHYDRIFESRGMDNEAGGADTLRHLFVLLVGLGMRESSGRWCEGRDRSATNTTAETAEAGLFQTSYNARSAHPTMRTTFDRYLNDPSGFLEVFQEGVTPKPRDLENFGSGRGREFQRLSKECPAFAAEFAAIGLRNLRKHWGPINRRKAEVRPECDEMLLRVQFAVDREDAPGPIV